jgi:hypothetical protein
MPDEANTALTAKPKRRGRPRGAIALPDAHRIDIVRDALVSLDKLAVNLVALMREPDGLDKLEEMGDGLMGQSTLKRLFRLTKEDLGVWRTRDHEATLA